MQILKFKTILFTFVGIFLFFSHIMLYREITASSAYPFFSAIFFLLFLTFWTGIGILLSPFKKADKPYFLFPLLCISPATLLSLTAVKLLTACYPVDNFANLALVALLGCFPPGVTLGVILVSSKRSVSAHLQKYAAFFGAIGYLLGGFALYPLALFNVLTNPWIYTLSANGLILFVALAAFRVKRIYSIRYWFLTFATILMAVNFALLQLERYSTQNFFATRYPDWQLVRPYQTHYGRVTLLRQSTHRFMLLKNTRIQQIIPDDSELYKTTVLPFSLQPDKKDLRALVIGSPFSYVPTILSSLPYIEHLTLLTGGKSTMPLTILRSFSPPPSPKMSIFNMNINEYLKKNKNKFDLIFWLFPSRYYLNFDTMVKLCALNLKGNGVLAVPASLLMVNNAQSTWKSVFKNKISIPGKSLVYAFSNAPLTANLKVLEKRLDKLDDREIKMFPPGTFSVIYSIPHQTPPVILDTNKSSIENLLIKSFASLNFNSRNILIILAWAGLYFLTRFFILRRKSLQATAGLFENGLCLMLLMMALMALFARHEGEFYYNFGVILSTISGIPMGLFLSQFKLRRTAVITSIIVILLSSLCFREYYSGLILCTAYVNFLCGGIIIADIFKQCPDFKVKLLSVHFLAAALGAAIMFTLLMAHFNLFVSLFIIILFRIPLMFSKMALGKPGNSGAD